MKSSSVLGERSWDAPSSNESEPGRGLWGLLVSFDQELRGRDPLMWAWGWLNVVLALGLLLLMILDTRLVTGVNVWIKPFKFSTSTVVFVWAVGWLMPLIQWRSQAYKQMIRLSVFGATLTEIALIDLQAGRGVASHFNTGSAFDGTIFNIMGAAIAWNTVVIFLLLLHFSQTKHLQPKVQANRSYLWGIRWGIFVFLLGSLVGGVSARSLAHTVGASDGGAGLPFLNWSTVAGDWRVAHFFGLHALQLLPLAGYGFSRWMGQKLTWPIHLLSMGYLGWVLLTFVQAAMGRPFLAL